MRGFRYVWRLLVMLPLLVVTHAAQAEGVTVYAAASLSSSLREVVGLWRVRHPADNVRISFAASSTLAKQIAAGAPADIFLSADQQWMDYLASRRVIDVASRRNLLGNSLVLVAPAGRPVPVRLLKGAPVPSFAGRLCMGEPGSVPAGVYGRQALQFLGWWPVLEQRIVATEDVRTALTFVERAACPLGIVYATDAAASRKVMILGVFPAASHAPVVYPLALLPGAPPAARELFDFLVSEAAAGVFRRHGFTVFSH